MFGFFEKVPNEVTLLIFDAVSPQTQITLAQVNKKFALMAKNPQSNLSKYKKDKKKE